MKSIIRTTNRVFLVVSFAVALSVMHSIAAAGILEIQYTGLDMNYDGSEITSIGDSDPLESVDFFIDGAKVLGLNAPGDSPIDIDLTIPGVNNLPISGGTVTSATGGTLSLTLPAGDYLDLELGPAEVTYVAVGSVQLHFLLAAGAGEVLGQLLPIDGEFGDIVAVSFSTNIDNSTLTDNGGFITGFVANGTGEIEGNIVPEPGTISLLLCGLTSFILLRRRQQ